MTANYRWFAVVYVVFMFFMLPGILVGLNFVDGKGIAMYTFLSLVALLGFVVATINCLQSHEKLGKILLPEKLRNWQFLPEPLRSLEPYDRILTGCSCCHRRDQEANEPMNEGNESNCVVPATNLAFSTTDEKGI